MTTRMSSASFAVAAAVMLTAILLYDVMGAIIKHLGQSYPTPQLAMFRNIFGLIPTLVILLCSQSWIQAGRPIAIRHGRSWDGCVSSPTRSRVGPTTTLEASHVAGARNQAVA